ncbi:hypothetical protein O0I10_007604 [Lichtheimia ornata]|uniref:Uncharacterized protein n=1 Tax=Lichtheimia ornata TaxID=688661 RepID=A0AAD7V090_9FUNG|nr:uncharacterized protein O0I10_007604 [Lichtheimia ornata]KAJ8656757.1 hypothetical protein O0I10_007604 [Lichtheimia ornata]
MFKLWQFLSKPFITHKEEQHDEATLNAQPDLGLPTFHYEMPPSLTAPPNQDQRTRNVVNIYPQVRRAQPPTPSPQVAYQPSVSAAGRSRDACKWITPVEHSVAVLSADAWNMLKPVEWEALGGAVVQRSVRVTDGRKGVDVLFGKRRHVLRLIQRKATGVHIRLQDDKLHLEGPNERIHRLLDFLDHLYARVGRSHRDYVIVRCNGPQLESKLERIDTLYKNHSGVPPFDRCRVVPMDELHFTLAKIEGQYSPALIKHVAETFYRIVQGLEKQHYMGSFTLDRIAFETNYSRNALAISSSEVDNPISKLKTICKARALLNSSVSFTKHLHMTILKSRSISAAGIDDVELSKVLPEDIRNDFLGPIFVDSFLVSRNITSMLTKNNRHVPYTTFKIV